MSELGLCDVIFLPILLQQGRTFSTITDIIYTLFIHPMYVQLLHQNLQLYTTFQLVQQQWPYRSNCPSRGLQPVTVSDRHLLWPTDHQLKKQTKTMEAQTAAHSLTGGLVMLASLPSIFRANLSRINPSSVYQLQHCVCVCVSLSLFHSEGGRQQILDCLSIVST